MNQLDMPTKRRRDSSPPCGTRQAAQATFAKAVQHHRSGQLAEADAGYRQVLASMPRHADSLHLLGLVAQQNGHIDTAIGLIRQAIAINGTAAPFHCTLGNALLQKGQGSDALACFHKAISLDPRLVEAHVNLGCALSEAGQVDDAIRHFRLALAVRPDLALVHNNLGDALRRKGRLDDAVASCRKALQLDPGHAEAHVNLGSALMLLERFDDAVACFRDALALRPDLVAAQINLGSALARQEKPDDAIAWFLKAIALQPNHADTYNNLGKVLMDQARVDEAVSCFVWATTLRPDHCDAHLNLSGAFQSRSRLDEALAHARHAEALAPDRVETLVGLGSTLRAQGRLDEAVASFERAIARCTDGRQLPRIHSDLAMALLARGDFERGWEEYEWRMQVMGPGRDFGVPQWRGEPAVGRTLLVHAEQGFGDTLQFCRFAPLAAKRGLRVVLEVQKPLLRLLRGLPGVEQVVAQGDALPHHDLHCPMMSLPLALHTTLDTMPARAPYLHADADRVAGWERRLAARGRRTPRVGVLWAGNSHEAKLRLALVDRRRSIPPAQLAPIFAVPGVQFVGLQKDGPSAPDGFPMIDLMNEMSDFADTAALVGTLDLVIAVDSAVAHLAGALGRPVWLMDRFDPCWRWLLGRSDSPWYPGLRIVRQPTPGDWEPVIARIADDLRGFAAAWTSPAAVGTAP